MHLVVFSHKLFRRTRDGLQTTGAYTIQMDALAPYFERVTLCVPVVDDATFRGMSVTSPNIDFHPLPHYAGRMGFLRAAPSMRREMLAVMEQADLALVILPGYVGTLASALCQRRRFPVFQWVVSDWSQCVLARRHNLLAHWWASLWAPLLDRLMMRLTRDVLTFYTGHILHNRGKSYHFTRVSSSIRQSDFYARDVTNITMPYRVLFVGRLSAEKGIAYLLEAISLLAAKGEAIELHIVGMGPLEDDLRHKARVLNIAEQVTFHGFIPQGEALRRLYRESDMLVLPSLQEQQGKVLLEAMASGLPIIASNIGGIPTVVRHEWNGLLIPPRDPSAISQAITRLITDSSLRKRLINNGLEYARQHTVERETEKMMNIVRSYYLNLFASFGGEARDDLS